MLQRTKNTAKVIFAAVQICLLVVKGQVFPVLSGQIF